MLRHFFYFFVFLGTFKKEEYSRKRKKHLNDEFNTIINLLLTYLTTYIPQIMVVLLAGAEEYTDCISEEG